MRRVSLTAVAWLLAVQAGSACAAMLEVSPIPVEAEAPASTSVMQLSNRATGTAVLQIRVFRWTQAAGDDQLAPTDEVTLSPPIASIPPGATQVVRLVRVAEAPVQAEESYRVLVDELPSSEPGQEATAVRLLTRYSIPLFYTPPASVTAPARLQWTLSRAAGRDWELVAVNAGGRRERVANLSLQAAGGNAWMPFGDNTLVGYVLSGQNRHWPVHPPQGFAAGGGTVQVQYRNDTGLVSAEVLLEPGH